MAIKKVIRGKWISDPSHGWLKVDKVYLRLLDIEQDITSCSYVRGDYVYLEEDQDASLLIETAGKKGWEVIYTSDKPSNKQSRVRGYDCYRSPFTGSTP